ncbi:VCBS domain-containing protein, partial [Chromobacterium piscinae]|uniref:VCBS domain-containing protein n=1 Tax=Chromobacterium piscinae TaxID=686831 RepID=UPI003261C95C
DNKTANLGSITIDANGNWHYSDDAAAFSGNDQGAVTEDANVSAANTLDYSGKLNVADVDQGQSSFDTSRVDNSGRCRPGPVFVRHLPRRQQDRQPRQHHHRRQR